MKSVRITLATLCTSYTGLCTMFVRCLLVSLLLFLLFIVVDRRLFQKVDVPGPLLGRITPYYRVWLLIQGDAPLKYAALHRKYGPVIRTGPNHVSISDSRSIPVVYDLKHQYLKVAKDHFPS